MYLYSDFFQSYFLGITESPLGPELFKVLDNGKRIKIDKTDYYKWGSDVLLKTAREQEIGTNYCWTEYNRI